MAATPNRHFRDCRPVFHFRGAQSGPAGGGVIVGYPDVVLQITFRVDPVLVARRGCGQRHLLHGDQCIIEWIVSDNSDRLGRVWDRGLGETGTD